MCSRLAAVAASLLSFATAGEEPAPGWEALVEQGVQARREGRDADALERFQAAYALSQAPRALAQIGLAEQALGRWVDAELHLTAALAADGDSWIDQHRTSLSEALRFVGEHLATLDVVGPPGAEVRVDGRVVGTLP